MPPYDIILHGQTAAGLPVAVLPQAQKMTFNGHMYNLEDGEGFSIDDLVDMYRDGYTLQFMISEMHPLASIGEYLYERLVQITLFKDGTQYDDVFLGVCKEDVDTNYDSAGDDDSAEDEDYEESDGEEADYEEPYREYYDDRQDKWQQIQRFMRQVLEKRQADMQARKMALLMGLNPRLGCESVIQFLPPEIVYRFIN